MKIRGASAFSLVEITLALGIVAFSLVGIIGVLPTAMTSSRQSFDKNRAVAIANTLFASFRSQPFNNVGYVDIQFDTNGTLLTGASPTPLDLNALYTDVSNPNSPTPEVTFCATFLDASNSVGVIGDPFGTQRRLLFSTATTGGADYLIKMHFNNNSNAANPLIGMEVTPVTAVPNGQPTVPAQANQIELIISSIARPSDQYHFVSVVANRTN